MGGRRGNRRRSASLRYALAQVRATPATIFPSRVCLNCGGSRVLRYAPTPSEAPFLVSPPSAPRATARCRVHVVAAIPPMRHRSCRASGDLVFHRSPPPARVSPSGSTGRAALHRMQNPSPSPFGGFNVLRVSTRWLGPVLSAAPELTAATVHHEKATPVTTRTLRRSCIELPQAARLLE